MAQAIMPPSGDPIDNPDTIDIDEDWDDDDGEVEWTEEDDTCADIADESSTELPDGFHEVNEEKEKAENTIYDSDVITNDPT